jgi:MGT family glycosyltransferase
VSTVAFFSFPAHGHVNPTLALVSGLAARGEKVIYYVAPLFAAKVAAAGAEPRIISTRFDRLIEEAGLTIGRNAFAIASGLMEASVELVGVISEELRKQRPDYIVHDAIAIYAMAVSQLLRIPAISTIPSPCWGRSRLRDAPPWFALDVLRQGLAALREVARYYAFSRRMTAACGIRVGPPLRVFSSYEELSIITTSRVFQHLADRLDPRKFVIAGPLLARAGDGSPIEGGDSGSPLVYVSLGTVCNNDRDFFRECFRAFADSSYRILVSTGAGIDPPSLGEAPPNFVVASTVPQTDVLRTAAVFVSHGGMNSLNEALYYGVPLVLVPRALDQFVNSRRAADLGAGIVVRRRSGVNIRRAVDRVMNEPGYRARARQLSAEIRAEGGVEKALEAILEFKRAHGIT